MTQLEKEIIDRYVSGESISSIYRSGVGKGYSSIQKLLLENDIPIRGGRKKIQLSEEQMSFFETNYCSNLKTLDELSQTLKVDKGVLKRIIAEKHWVKCNNNKINKRIISNYFETIDTEEKAYWLGFLLTDGSVDNKNRIRVQLQERDLEILEKFHSALQLDSKIIYDKREGKHCYSVEFADAKMCLDLAKYGIVPRKTYVTKHLPLNQIPQELQKHFIRGVYDGDGGLTYSADLSTDITFGFTSYSETMVQDFQAFIDNMIGKKEHNKNIYTSCWYSNWRGYNQVVNILDNLYEDATIYLDRKYKKYLVLKNRNN